MRIPPWALALGGLALVLGLVSSATARVPTGGPLLVSLWYYAHSHVDDALWSGDPAVWAAIDIVNPRILVGTEPVPALVSMDALVKLAQRFNKRMDGHGAVNARSIAEAEAEAEAAAEVCTRYGLHTWHANAEDAWAGTSGKARTADPEGTMAAYGARFRAECRARGIKPWLAWTNYSWPTTSDGRPLATARSLADFDVWAPMLYTNGRDGGVATLRRIWRERLYRLDAAGARRMRLAPLVATERDAGDGTYWGEWDTLEDLVTTGERPISELGFYYGAGSKGMLTKGNAHTEPLTRELAQLRAAYRSRWA